MGPAASEPTFSCWLLPSIIARFGCMIGVKTLKVEAEFKCKQTKDDIFKYIIPVMFFKFEKQVFKDFWSDEAKATR